jgi:translocation and assembly module TamB
MLTLTGELKVIRGDFEFIGERFKLTEGNIWFLGSRPIQPRLNIRAETRKKDITARFVLTGSSSDPEIRFESDPPLPQDEVLSRVLFNRRLNQITPMQAVRLADALRSLSGRGDALDVIERTRSFLGLQALEMREAEDTEGEFALGIGKYLTEDIYVDLEKGMGNETGRVAVTIELHPNVTLESKAGMDSPKGMGLNWKWDY